MLGRFISPDSVVPGSGPLTLAPHDAVAAGAWAAGGGGPANPQNLNRYAYAGNSPVNRTDPTGHDWEHFVQYATGVVAGAYHALASTAEMGQLGAPLRIGSELGYSIGSDPRGFIASLQNQANEVAEGAHLAGSDPAKALGILYDRSHEVGQIMGGAAATAGMAKAVSVIGARGNVNLYRAVDATEYSDLQQIRAFRLGGGSEGKHFAETPQHAARWGQLMLGEGNYTVVGARVPLATPHTRWTKLDGIGPARFYSFEHLHEVRYTGRAR